MSSSTQNEFDRNAGAADAEKMLRVIATLPAPEGIEERMKAGLRAAPSRSVMLEWPGYSRGNRSWMHSSLSRVAAAAAIVAIVAGGGWGVYARFQPAASPTAVAAPQRTGSGSGLSPAGAMRVPKTLDGPVLTTPADQKEKPPATPHSRSHRSQGKGSAAPATR